ncbi:MAG: hypothetical protein KDE54_03505 [Caldilineaceae bacterium]|nr:hypothetical protein [Caldilineaceae bacterium]MCB0094222.1 hypothetical protein [Caldilineaceae bacterium]
MSEGEGGYNPYSKNRRDFLKDALKIGAGVAIGAASGITSERLTTQQNTTTETSSSPTPEAASNEVVKPEKHTILEFSSTNMEPLEVVFTVKNDNTLKAEDLMRVENMPFGTLGSTAVGMSQRLIQMAMAGQSLSQEQRAALTEACVELQAKFNDIVAPQKNAPQT